MRALGNLASAREDSSEALKWPFKNIELLECIAMVLQLMHPPTDALRAATELSERPDTATMAIEPPGLS